MPERIVVDLDAGSLEYRPELPAASRGGIGIVGCGNIVLHAHLPAYAQYGLDVVGFYDRDTAASTAAAARYGAGRVFATFAELLENPDVAVVDIATPPDARAELVQQALERGKHVLAQKPFAGSVASARALAAEAERRKLKLAVNMNGRWAPPWRIATLLVQQGAIGDVVAISHSYSTSFDSTVGSHFDEMPHFLLYDYSSHWFDISRCWLEGKTIETVRARDRRAPNQPAGSRTPWTAWVVIECEDGTTATIHAVGSARCGRPGHPFVIHGSDGRIEGSVLGADDRVELCRAGDVRRFPYDGTWFPDGFAGAMGELLSAIEEDREPYNSAAHNLLSLQLTLAAVLSSERAGAPVRLEEVS